MERMQVVLGTKLGLLRGQAKQSQLSNKTYYAFQGIPFAKPPVGELRFKAPEPFGGWEGIRDALEDGSDPKQPVMMPKPGMDPNQVAEGDEDCLYLSVCTNELPKKNSAKRPVMVSIHGGGFIGGSGALKTAGPDFLMEEDIVFVTFNYRCGPFGFLNLEIEDVPGNAGLKDQVLALQWVKDNIESFGGDPDNVTIFGISGGGASVDYHLLSPLSRGLFHKAITQSGFTYSTWAFQPKPRSTALKLAQVLGCTSENSGDILEFLKSVSSDDIIAATLKVSNNNEYLMNCFLVFSPSVEVCGTNRFLSDSPDKLLKRGEFNKVPVIVGLSELEGVMGIWIILMGKISEEQLLSIVNSNPQLLVPAILGIKRGSDDEKEVTKAIWDFYFKGNPLSLDNLYDYVLFQSDILFNIGFGMSRSALVEKSTSPVYTYLFTNHTRCVCSVFKLMTTGNDKKIDLYKKGTCHGADCQFIYFTTSMGPIPELTADIKEAIFKHIKAWAEFALTGNPNCAELQVTWERDSVSRPCFMDIGTTWELKEGTPFAERFVFWKNIYSKYCS